MESLEINRRDKNTCHSAKKERRKGLVPGVLYGKDMQNLLFEVGELELAREIAAKGQHGIINYTLDGKSNKALIKEVQRDAVNHNLIHIDLEDIKGDALIQSEVPINYIGEEWLNSKGVVLQKEQDLVRVECTPDALPKYVSIDVTNSLAGSVFRYSDLEVASEISILDDLEGVIASVSNERKLVSELGEEEEKAEEAKK